METELNEMRASSLMYELMASTFMSGKLVGKRKVCASHRISIREIISSVEEILETFGKKDQPSAIVITRL